MKDYEFTVVIERDEDGRFVAICPALQGCYTEGETEEEARLYADRLLSKLDEDAGKAIREQSLDAKNYGVQRQQELRSAAGGDGFVEDNLWTGIGRARSGCGAAIVGTPDQVLAKLRAYQAEGIEAFILSGYPHMQEADMFARHVLPHIQHGPLTL